MKRSVDVFFFFFPDFAEVTDLLPAPTLLPLFFAMVKVSDAAIPDVSIWMPVAMVVTLSARAEAAAASASFPTCGCWRARSSRAAKNPGYKRWFKSYVFA